MLHAYMSGSFSRPKSFASINETTEHKISCDLKVLWLEKYDCVFRHLTSGCDIGAGRFVATCLQAHEVQGYHEEKRRRKWDAKLKTLRELRIPADFTFISTLVVKPLLYTGTMSLGQFSTTLTSQFNQGLFCCQLADSGSICHKHAIKPHSWWDSTCQDRLTLFQEKKINNELLYHNNIKTVKCCLLSLDLRFTHP